MKVIGLTGSIAMGKSTTAALFRRRGIAVYDADREVHKLSDRGGRAVPAIEMAFPGIVKQGAVDRAKLSGLVFQDRAALLQLEAILHPMIGAQRRRFLRRQRAAGAPLVVLDIPLLLEKGGADQVDYVVVVSCPAFLQRARALARPGMTEAKLAAILAQQMKDSEKRRRADLVIPTGRGPREVIRQIELLRRRLLQESP